MRRIMCVWFPQLPLDRRLRLGDPRVDGPFAVISEIKNAFRLTHLSEQALSHGLLAGMSVADARAIAPDLMTELGDPVREALLLGALMRWAGRLSPRIRDLPPDTLIIDISGCAHLFGGEHKMAVQTISQLSDMNITSRIAIADTKGAARALARFHKDVISVSDHGDLRRSLHHLPVAGLDIPVAMTHDLRRIGFKTIGQLYDHKSSELARRFGLELPQALAKALGHTPDPVCPQDHETHFAARMNLPAPIGLKKDMDEVLRRLCISVCSRLRKAQRGGRRFDLTVRCVDSGDHVLSAGFAHPTHDQAMIKRQFERPLDNLKIEYGADWFRLVAEEVEPLQAKQIQILSEPANQSEDISGLITTLGNRLGFDKVQRFVPGDSHLPDQEFSVIEAVETHPVLDWPMAEKLRPVRLFRPERLQTITPGRPPKVFTWRKTTYEILHCAGPERLYPEWWRDYRASIRDYWRVMTKCGQRLWLLTFPSSKTPDWYVTGQFA